MSELKNVVFGNTQVVKQPIQRTTIPTAPVTSTVQKTVEPVKAPVNAVIDITKYQDPSVVIPQGIEIGKKIKTLGFELKNIIVEREDLIDDVMVALTTGNHVVMLGDPGIAKSMLARELCKRIVGGQYFEWLLNKTSDPSEILGPYSIKALEQDKFTRRTVGKLPEAHIAFLDEIFKSNEPTLNALLAITNERVFHNDGHATPIPLISLIGASNEEPEDESLKALYDRLLFRFMVEPIGDAGNRMKMYQGFLDRRNPQTSSFSNITVTIDELIMARMASRYVTIPKDILNQYDSLLMDLKIKHQIVVTDRRKNEGLGVLQGAAIVGGRDIVTIDDFRHLASVWWQRVEDVKVIRDAIMKVANPYESKLQEHRANIDAVLKRVQEASEQQRPVVALEAKNLLNQVHKSLDQMCKEAKDRGKDTAKIEDMKKLVYAKQKEILNKFMGIDETILKSTGFSNEDDEDSIF